MNNVIIYKTFEMYIQENGIIRRTSDGLLLGRLSNDIKFSDLKTEYKPNLGCATTRELLDEIRARLEVDNLLEYKTIDSD